MFHWKSLRAFVGRRDRDPSMVVSTGQTPWLAGEPPGAGETPTTLARMPRHTLAPIARETLGMLDAETSAEHATADADVYRILDEPSESAYRHYLAATYHFEYAVELQLARVVDLATPLLARCSHAAELVDDLLALGADHGVLGVLVRPIDLPAIETVPEAFGWLYVVQRNTLHHRALFRALVPRLRASLRSASRYLTAHANDAYERWSTLGGEMDRIAREGDAAAKIVCAAKEAFALQHRWYVEAWATRTTPQPRPRAATSSAGARPSTT